MSNQHHHYQSHQHTVIPVTVNPSDDQRFIRFRSSDASSNDINNRMSTRMRDFEDECRRWREKFFNESHTNDSQTFPSTSVVHSKPRMRMDFPDFPEFGGVDWPALRAPGSGLATTVNSAGQRAFIEEDNDGRKKYKIQFDIGEFRPDELSIKVDGRLLMVKGDRQIKVGNATESKQFNREITLPEFVDAKTLEANLAEQGQLTVEAPVLMDRVYQDSALTSSPYQQSIPGRIVDTTFAGGRQPVNNFNLGGNTQASSFSSSFRQESSSSSNTGGANNSTSSHFIHQNPLRDQYSSTNSTIVSNQPSPVTFSTITARPEQSISDRHDGTKNVTYKFNLSEFAPEDIAIQINDTMLKVSALRQERDGHSTSHREFKREIGLPDGADAKRLTNTLSADGILTIQIPVRDYRPPTTPTQSSTAFHLPTNLGENNSYAVGDQQLKLTFDLSGYRPDDVSVKVNENVLKVQAVHIDNTRGNQINREYLREYVLPEWVDVDQLRAKLSEDSTLTVEVPIPHDRVPAFNRQIKITK